MRIRALLRGTRLAVQRAAREQSLQPTRRAPWPAQRVRGAHPRAGAQLVDARSDELDARLVRVRAARTRPRARESAAPGRRRSRVLRDAFTSVDLLETIYVAQSTLLTAGSHHIEVRATSNGALAQHREKRSTRIWRRSIRGVIVEFVRALTAAPCLQKQRVALVPKAWRLSSWLLTKAILSVPVVRLTAVEGCIPFVRAGAHSGGVADGAVIQKQANNVDVFLQASAPIVAGARRALISTTDATPVERAAPIEDFSVWLLRRARHAVINLTASTSPVARTRIVIVQRALVLRHRL